jgi:23S rRNA (cytidine1920-2'-O)/16S rRNA (cytidine1409-2'-O)-methyltransferase
LSRVVASRYPALADPDAAIRAGHVLVDGWPARNPNTLVDAGAAVVLRLPQPLRGAVKLGAALATFAPAVAGQVALDVGAAAGGFTRALLDAGARRVYAVDAGHGQLLGSLRQDRRVVNLEATNLGDLDPTLIPDPIGVVTIDVSYLALARAIPQLAGVPFAPGAELVALVKPMFELALPAPPPDERLDEALAHAAAGIEGAGWKVLASMRSPVRGARGAVELFLWARRR